MLHTIHAAQLPVEKVIVVLFLKPPVALTVNIAVHRVLLAVRKLKSARETISLCPSCVEDLRQAKDNK